MAIKALLFDFDGTLLDTNDLILETFMHVLEEKFPGQYTKNDCLQFIGPSLYQTFSQITPNEVDEMVAKYRAWNELHHDEFVKQYDGVVETLEELHKRGIRLAIVSTKISANIMRGLNVLGVTHLFEQIIGMDHVVHVKPHPEPVLKALDLLGVEKDEVIMIGDNSHDIEGGKNAGVKTAGVAWSIKGVEFLKSYHPDYILNHMSDLLTIVSDINEENRAL